MKTIRLGTRGPIVSRLGFGAMRLPMGDDGRVNRALVIPLLHRALELGVTYYDTAVGYCRGDSQRVLGEAFEGLRDRVVLSTKNPAHTASEAEWWAHLEESLRLLRTEVLDVYHFHGLTWETYEKHIREPGKMRLMRKAKEQGLVRHIAASFHDSPDALVRLVETGDFDIVTVQYNLLFRELEPALERCRQLGIGVVVMGPIGGGRLGVPSDRIRELLRGEAASTPEAALRFVLANPAVHVALSGMSTLEQLEENAAVVTHKAPFTPAQIAALEDELARTRERLGIHCPGCGYCLPCPLGVDIPENFRIYNEWKLFGLEPAARRAYAGLSRPASACVECGACLPKCPQKLAIPTLLRRVMGELDEQAQGVAASLFVYGAATSNRLKTQIIVRNFNRPAIPLRLALTAEGGSTSDPAVFDVPSLSPDRSRILRTSFHVPDGLGVLRGTLGLQWEKEQREIPFSVPFFIVPEGVWRRHEALVKPSAFTNPAEASRHSYSVFLRRVGSTLEARVVIRSPLQGLANGPEPTGGRLELFVDLRPKSAGAPNVYEEGVEQYFLFLKEPGLCRSRSGRNAPLDYRVKRTDEGADVWITLSLPELPEFGLDWMLVVADEQEHETAHLVYGGRGGLWQKPRQFTRAYCVTASS